MKHRIVLIKYILLSFFSVLSLILPSCSADNFDERDVSIIPTPQIIVLYGPGGLGDQGYMDCILSGVQMFKRKHYSEVDMYQYSPSTMEEAARLVNDWLSLPQSNVPALFVVASSDYELLITESLSRHSLTNNKRMLMFENDTHLDLPVTIFQMSMYGASYLAGVTAAEYVRNLGEDTGTKNALILLAHPNDKTIAKSGVGFKAGFDSAAPDAVAYTEYLADDWTGYASAQTAYQRMSKWSKDYAFVFPVAGGSNQGIFRYTREYPDSPLTAGMDIDQSGLSRNIMGSVIKHIDKVVFDFMETWLSTGELPESTVFGLESGYVDWILSPRYSQYQSIVDKARQEAIRKEVSEL
ncbi:MAG: BMP family ABC transporter substrate-binding protein [Muribaculaceae bacterium]|nr:BMP family ABC transporter substrate-binding protein [Muribaculaceae bacterium]